MEIKGGRPVAYAFTGVRKLGDPTPIAATDQFHLGSDTKAMTAALIGLLIEESKLRWESTLGEIFPKLAMNSAYRSVNIAMLAAHRAGLPKDPDNEKYWESLWALDPVKGRRKVLENALHMPPAGVPGIRFSYSNIGYVILGAVIDKTSGQTYERFIQHRLFSKLGMDSCGFGPMGNPNSIHPDEPWGHTAKNGVLAPVAPTPQADNPPAYNSAARAHCSLADWGKFLQMELDGFNGKTGLLLLPAIFSKLQAVYPGQDYTYGGWLKASRNWTGGPAFHHEGSNTMNVALAWLAPLKNEIFMSASNAPIPRARPALVQAISYLIHSSR